MSEVGKSLAEELAVSRMEHDAVVTALGSFFPRGHWDPADSRFVRYGSEAGEVCLSLEYGRDGQLRDVQRGPGLTDEMLEELKATLAALAEPKEIVVWRDVFFNVYAVDGFWRYRDEWQIVPAPPGAPRPDFLYADHPFVVEIRVPSYPKEQSFISASTNNRRAWELQLILTLVLHGEVKRIGPKHSGHVWAFVREPDQESGDLTSKYVQPGYSIPGWVYQSADFTPTDELTPIREVPDFAYRSRDGISPGDRLEVPDILRPLLDHYRGVAPEVRDRFLHACYWYERSGAGWWMSVSLAHIAAVNAIETLMPPGEVDRCPTCGLNRAPGVTRRFRNLVERYASETPSEDRRSIYKLRSGLVHEGRLLDIDSPGPWGALVPRQIEQTETYTSARAAARQTIINWLLDQPTGVSGRG